MDKAQKAIAASLVITSAIAWIASAQQPEMMMMAAMMDASSYNPLAISLFTAIWTAGMAAMMFPAITPMVLLYNTFVTSRGGSSSSRGSNSPVTIQQGEEESKPPVPPPRPAPSSSSSSSSSPSPSSLSSLPIHSLRVTLFVGCYLLVWALTGIALLLGWSAIMNSTITIMTTAEEGGGNSSSLLLLQNNIYGALLLIAGAYQFTPLKKTCIGYCESPMSFFMRRWKGGTSGAVKMGVWHGMYCLGCCWPYFLLMVALGWMNLLWMGLFAGIIFGEKMWNRGGIWVARAAGVGLAIVGILVIAGMLSSSSLSSLSPPPMGSSTDGDSSISGNRDMAMDDDKEVESSMVIPDDERSSASPQSEGMSDMKME